ncbi:hypothetical protein SH449x_000396 [Pirellulaceae bacterium SH449]
MFRNILAIILAFFIGGLCVLTLETVGHRIYPVPSELDANDMEQVAQYVSSAPVGALLFVLLAQSAGSFAGGLVTAIVGGSRLWLLAIIYGVLALLMAGLNVILIPHPLWMTTLALVLPIPLSLLGSRAGQLLKPQRVAVPAIS